MFNRDIFIGQVVSEVLDQFLSVGAVQGRTNKVLSNFTKYVEKGQTDQTTKMLIFWVISILYYYLN